MKSPPQESAFSAHHLPQERPSDAQAKMCGCPVDIIRTLSNALSGHCPDIVQTLSRHCPVDIVQTLSGHCPVEIVHFYFKLR